MELLREPRLLARVHRAFVLLHTWVGPQRQALAHTRPALAHARSLGDQDVAWSVHWAMAVMAGMSGNGELVRTHQGEAQRLAVELGSPVLMVRSAEVGVEWLAATGAWEEGLRQAGRAILLARSVAPHTVLPRLLVLAAVMHLERDEGDVAEQYVREAWEVATAEGRREWGDPRAVVAAYVGVGTLHLKRREFAKAAEVLEEGLAIVDRLGLVAWGIHRVMPLLCEAHLFATEYERAESLCRRLHRESEAYGHALGLAYAAGARALLARLRDQDSAAHVSIVAAAEQMEGIPFVFAGARLRLNAAQVMVADGQQVAAREQLLKAHAVFARVGAVRELALTRAEMTRAGMRARDVVVRGEGLTGREREVAQLLAQWKSNKEIAVALGIATRTAESHVEKVLAKLGVSRAQVRDVVDAW